MKIYKLKNDIIKLLNESQVSVEEGYYAIYDVYTIVSNQYDEALKNLAEIQAEAMKDIKNIQEQEKEEEKE